MINYKTVVDRATFIVAGIVASLAFQAFFPLQRLYYGTKTSEWAHDMQIAALADNLNSHELPVKEYATWKLGEMGTAAHAALPALERLDRENEDEAFAHALASSLRKVKGR